MIRLGEIRNLEVLYFQFSKNHFEKRQIEKSSASTGKRGAGTTKTKDLKLFMRPFKAFLKAKDYFDLIRGNLIWKK